MQGKNAQESSKQKSHNKNALMINYFTCDFLSSCGDIPFILQLIFSKSSISSAFDVFSPGSGCVVIQYPDLFKRRKHLLRSWYYLTFKIQVELVSNQSLTLKE